MATQDEMLEALEQLKMLSGEGMFEHKELKWPWSRGKVADDSISRQSFAQPNQEIM